MRLKHLLSVFLTLLTLSVGQMWGVGTTVTYTVSTATTVTSSGTAPTGSTASISGGSLNSGFIQCTNGVSSTFTLTGYAGYKITGITINVKSNKSSGTGSFSVVAGTTSLASIAENAFNDAAWNGAWSQTGVDKTLTMTNNSYEIKKDENVTFTISCKSGGKTYNSLYISSWAITYEAVGGGCNKKISLATGNPTNGTISFSPTSPVETCNGSVNVTMTITPNAGYYLSAYSKTGVNTSNTPSIATGTSATAAQTPTLTFGTNTNGTYTAGATFTALVDHFIDEVQNSTGYTGEGMAKSGNYSNSLPTIADKTVATTGNCQALHYHFVGWVLSEYKDNPTGHIATLNGHATGATYYAVWAKQGESGDITDEITRAKVVGANSNIGSNGNSSWATATLTGFSSGAQYFVRSMGLNNATNYAMRWNDNGYLYCSTAPSSGMKLKSVTVTTTANKNIGIYGATSKYSAKATATSLNTLSATSSGVTYNLTSAQLANNYTCVGINGTASSTEVVSISITYSNVAYTDYITQCCQELGSINGSFFWTTHFCPVWPAKHRLKGYYTNLGITSG